VGSQPNTHSRSFPSAYHWLAIVVASIGAAILVFWTATSRPMWVDEEMLALNVRDRSFHQLTGELWLDQSAPLGWLALERLAMIGLGTGERAVRLLTVLFGAGTLATAVWIGRRWMGPVGAVVLAALCAFGEWIVFFTLELKHYSADTFWALLLPALAAWTLEALDAAATRRRLAGWWAAATVGQWLGNGALFVTPACAVVLWVACWRRDGKRLASFFATTGLLWLGSFALCYAIVLRHAIENAYLKSYWAFAFPPTADGARATLSWLGTQLGPFAVKPGGSGLPALFWASCAGGIAFATARRSRCFSLGIMFATVPLSALALGLLHVIPPFERLALWSVPALYAGVGMCADGCAWLARRVFRESRVALPVVLAGLITTGIAAGLAAGAVTVDVVRRGVSALEHRPRSNYGLDDRSSVRWTLASRREGDAVVTTHYGLAAMWWYGGVNISDRERSGHFEDGTPMFEIGYVPTGPECDRWEAAMTDALAGRARVVLYLGFRLNVEPVGFDDLVLEVLGRRGALVGYKEYAEESRLAVFDLRESTGGRLVIPHQRPGRSSDPIPRAVDGCVSLKPARRW
jgi:hypothetical protein